MGIRAAGVDYDNKPKEASLTVSKDNKLYHVFRFLQRAYGNDIGRFLTSFNSVLALSALSRRIESKKLTFTLNVLKYGVPAFLHGADLYNNIKNYIKEVKEEQSPIYNKRIHKYFQLLELKEKDKDDNKINEHDIQVDLDLVSWLTQRPNTKTIKMLGLFNLDTLNEMDSINNLDNLKTPIAVKLEFENKKYLLVATVVTFGNTVHIDQSAIVGLYISWPEGEKIRHALTCEYIEGLNIDKNILYFNDLGNVKCSPRIKVEEIINQYDVPAFIKEIHQVLDCGRKRAYVFVSRPGTGKSTILRKIEETMTDTVIFKMSPEDLGSTSKIEDRFFIAGKMKKSIVIIEDLDACGMNEKNSETGVFLDAIDDVNSALNMVILVTVNDTSRVHFSVINRPGRFDRVIEIKPPQTIEEIFAIMKSKANKLKRNYCPSTCFDIPPYSWSEVEAIGSQSHEPNQIDHSLLKECLKHDYTQAEIANAITEQIFLEASMAIKEGRLTWETAYENFNMFFKKAIKSHENTRRALANCNFNNENPMDKLNNKKYASMDKPNNKEYGDKVPADPQTTRG